MKEKGKNKKILILSRKYPPSTGGMELFARDFIRRMERVYDVDKIVLGGGQANLAWFIPYLSAAAAFLIVTRRYDLVYLCDGLLAPLGVMLKKIFRVKVAVTVHGLDVTYDRFFYQCVVPGAIGALDRVVCVSGNTMEECMKRGIPAGKCVLIPNAVEPDEYRTGRSRQECLKDLGRSIGERLEGKRVLITVGRLVKRKGVEWFVKSVMPGLPGEYVYLVAGEGPERASIQSGIDREGLGGRVKLLGKVDRVTLKLLYNSAFAMIMPNQKIEKDPEGFGIVAIEGASCGLPVIANSVDGIGDAVLDGRTGWLVDYNDVGIFKDRIKDPGIPAETVKKESEIFGWDKVMERYRELVSSFS